MSTRKLEREGVKAHFDKDVADHVMTILRDDGVDRHILFKAPDTNNYRFDIITWGGRLYIGGDCGTYVFERLQDMFQFFRSEGGRSINPSYWAEKVEAADRCDGVKVFEWATFEADVKDFFEQSWDIGELSEDASDAERSVHAAEVAARAACWEEVENALSFADQDEYGACAMIREFSHEGWRFDDWERDSKEFSFRYLWNCHAIQWAIAQYDAYKAAPKQAAGNDASFGAKAIAA